MSVRFTLESHDTCATIYHAVTGRILGTIRRPYETRAFQKAVPHGDQWQVTATDGCPVYLSMFRPTRSTVARALGLPV